jgi:hypothetical protein
MSKIGLIVFSLFISFFISNQLVMAQGESVFGPIEEPVGVAEYNDDAEGGIGLLKFISNMIKIASIVAGVWVMFNFITAGFTYVTAAGDSGAYSKIGEKLSYRVSGLLLIVASYTLAGIVSLIVFGDATYILNPEIPTAIETPAP